MYSLFKVFMPADVDAPLLETLHSGHITQGSKVDEFEKALSVKAGTTYVLTVNSGTTALSLALRLANVGPGDEVISTPMTCIATNVPIATAGAKIVWADVHPDTGLIDPDDVQKKITKHTKAIMAVDWSGIPADYDTLREVADGIPVISDAAHSFGSVYKGRRTGTLADFTAFSFQAIKTITTGDGGALTCKNPDDYERGKRLRWFGIDRDNTTQFRGQLDVPEAGFKWHMNDINATIGLTTLKFVQIPLDRQKDGANRYYRQLARGFYEFPNTEYSMNSAAWLMVVLLPDHLERKGFVNYMKAGDVEVSQVHWRNDKHSAFAAFADDDLPGLDQYADRMICIPNHYGLMPEDRRYIIQRMNDYANG